MSRSPEAFRQHVKEPFLMFNTLFLNLPFRDIQSTGEHIPLLLHACEDGLARGLSPEAIMDRFFSETLNVDSEKDRLDFMFRVVQFVERQVVLFDSVEEAAASKIDRWEGRPLMHLIRDDADGRYKDALSRFRARIVFTAHPTQFYPPQVLRIINRLRRFIGRGDRKRMTQTLQQLGMTSLLSSKKPTPLEEAQNIIHLMREHHYGAAARLYHDIKTATGDPDFENERLIELGFWPGGDRDGNPFVTSAVTRQVAEELRLAIIKCYHHDLKQLDSKLTFRGVTEHVAALRKHVYEALFNPEAPFEPTELLDGLEVIREKVVEDYNGLHADDVELLMDKVRLFGAHFATMDIRQHHRIHGEAVKAVLKANGVVKASLEEIDPDELRTMLLEGSMHMAVVDLDGLDPVVADVFSTMRLMVEIQKRNGERGCNRYVISNAEDAWSVLFVFALARWCQETEEPAIDIIPLFETVSGMDAAAGVMRSLFEEPVYRQHVRRRADRHTLMLGFSDGTKDGGYLKANWAIHDTKEALTAACRDAGIEAVFFDGRGGPPARGGGRTNRFYASQGPAIASHALELTIQGQVITSLYGTPQLFSRNVEELIQAGIGGGAPGIISPNAATENISDRDRALLDELAESAFEAYSELKGHPSFVPYLETKSTLRFYSRVNVGSRPVSRGSSEKLVFEDLRAIPFVGAWSQLKQNVPGYFGLGTALMKLDEAGRLDEAVRLFKEVPFFKTLILNSMMSLSKSNFQLTTYMSDDDDFSAFWFMIKEEYVRTRALLLQISGYDELMDEEPVSRMSVAIRERIVLPLLIIQQYALQKLAIKGGDKSRRDVFEKLVTRTLYGNINASRNAV
jgi:phosphoenolpyruvate carboxylase